MGNFHLLVSSRIAFLLGWKTRGKYTVEFIHLKKCGPKADNTLTLPTMSPSNRYSKPKMLKKKKKVLGISVYYTLLNGDKKWETQTTCCFMDTQTHSLLQSALLTAFYYPLHALCVYLTSDLKSPLVWDKHSTVSIPLAFVILLLMFKSV